jgi:hypothetical protein
MNEYQVTIAYKAVFTVKVKAGDSIDAECIAQKAFEKQREKFYSPKFHIERDYYDSYGCVNMDETYNMITG